MNQAQTKRKFPIGAEVMSGGVSFRVYAPLCSSVEVCQEGDKQAIFSLTPEGNGYFSATLDAFQDRALYRFKLDHGDELIADPASRFQPDGPFGPSQVIDGSKFAWTDQDWKGVYGTCQFIYEMHLGTFTSEGTYQAAQKELSNLAELGINVIELMPLNDFPGRFGWGYDGVNLFAPTRLYGNTEDLKNFINEAHKLKIAVILDVVYNHFGPAGNFLQKFSTDYFEDHETEWGLGINFNVEETREFFLTNARYWIEEYHFDGLRLDATQSIHSETPIHILQEINRVAKEAGKDKRILVVGENEPQHSIINRPLNRGGYGVDALWNDDFHHSAMVRLTGKREAYYKDYRGWPQEFIASAKHGFLYQGQYYSWQEKGRGTPCLDLEGSAFILFLQNHDQIANSGKGLRIHQLTDPGSLRAMTCFMIITPGLPMIFQGQEFASSSPFFYFADHVESLNKMIRTGRRQFLSQFRNLATQEIRSQLPDPGEIGTFNKCKLNFKERQQTFNSQIWQLHADLIRLRKNDSLLAQKKPDIDAAILNENSFIIRYFGQSNNDRLIIINFGADYEYSPCPEPLLAPCSNSVWEILWSSESVQYGGQGTAPIKTNPWIISGRSALILKSVEQ